MLRDDCLKHILGIVVNVFDAHSAVLFLKMDDGKYAMAEHFSLSDKILTDAVLESGMGLAGWIIRNGEPIYKNNYDQTKSVLGYYESGEDARIKAFMGCPLGKELGVLCLDSKQTYSYGNKDLKILGQFAQLITFVHEKACSLAADELKGGYYQAVRMLHTLRQRHPRWTAFLSQYLNLVSGASGFRHAVLAARDEYGRAYFLEGANSELYESVCREGRSFPIGTGMAGWVFKNEAPLYAVDPGKVQSPPFGGAVPSADMKGVVCLPIIVHKRTRGVLVLANEDPVALGPDLKEFLHMCTDYLSLFLETLYLRNKLAEQREADPVPAPGSSNDQAD